MTNDDATSANNSVPDLDIPADFEMGVATSAWQIEGDLSLLVGMARLPTHPDARLHGVRALAQQIARAGAIDGLVDVLRHDPARHVRAAAAAACMQLTSQYCVLVCVAQIGRRLPLHVRSITSIRRALAILNCRANEVCNFTRYRPCT